MTAETFTLDTSGEVQFRDSHGELMSYRWIELTPFVQGYIEALFAEISEWATHTYDEAAGAQVPLGFRHLAPEALAAILTDCEAMLSSLHISESRDSGRNAWDARQTGWKTWGTTPRKRFPPLTPTLGEDGLGYLSPERSGVKNEGNQ
jgi:hypothetical protein